MPPAKVERCEFELEANKQHCLTHRAVFNNFPDDYKEAVIEAVSEDLELTDDAIDGIRTQSSHDAIDYIASREVMTAKHALRQTLLHSILHFRCHQLAHVASTPADKTKVTDIMKDVLAWCALDYIPGKTADVVKQVFPEFQFPVTPPRKEVAERLPPWVDGAIVLNTTTPAVPQPVHKPARKPPTKAKAGSGSAKSGGAKGSQVPVGKSKDDSASAARPKAGAAGGDSAELESLRRQLYQAQTNLLLALAGAHIQSLNTAVETANKNMKHLARRARESSFEMKSELDDDFRITPVSMPESLRIALAAAGGGRPGVSRWVVAPWCELKLGLSGMLCLRRVTAYHNARWLDQM